ncbi:MAG TPA: response regulator [Terriglobales bacterium]
MASRALIVDDEPSILVTLELVLKSEGFEVDTAPSAQAAKACLGRQTFDFVLTDLSLETRSSGYEVVRAAKKHPSRPVTVVISGFPDLLNQWEAEGADAGLQKPTDVPELLNTIRGLLARRKGCAA